MVAKGIGKAQVVEDGGDVFGVADLEGLVKALGGVNGENQPRQNGKGERKAREASGPAPEPLRRKGLAANENPQGQQGNGYQDYRRDLRRRIVDVVALQGAAHLF